MPVTTTETRTIPIFPLNTVLYPGGALPLRIFEPRYLDMVGACLRNDTGFGVCLISDGDETGDAARHFEYGTLGKISYWQQLPEGLLGITLRGEQRFRILSTKVQANQLTLAEVELVPHEATIELPTRFGILTEMVREMLEEMGHPYTTLPKHYDDASWVGYRLAELLPISHVQKQYFLQLEDPIDRLERLSSILVEIDEG